MDLDDTQRHDDGGKKRDCQPSYADQPLLQAMICIALDADGTDMAGIELEKGFTLGLALLGAVLGVINTARAMLRDQVKLKAAVIWETRRVATPDGGAISISSTSGANDIELDRGRIGIRVTNLGFVEVTVDSIGFVTEGWIKRKLLGFKRRALNGDVYEQARLPVRLKPRECATFYIADRGPGAVKFLNGVTRVFATTACGVDVFGTSRLLKRIVREADRRS